MMQKVVSFLMLLVLRCSLAWASTSTAIVSVSATVSGVNSLELSLLNFSDDQSSPKVQYANPSGIVKASQYMRIDFDSNALGAKIVLRTDNRNSAPAFTGPGEGAGLVGSSDTKRTVPVLWAVFPDLASAKNFSFTGDTDPDGTAVGTLPGAKPRPAGEAEGLVVDKANTNFETQAVLGYATVVAPNGVSGLLGNFPTDEDGAGPKTGSRSANSPVFLVLGADFLGASPQAYGTTTLGLDLVVQ